MAFRLGHAAEGRCSGLHLQPDAHDRCVECRPSPALCPHAMSATIPCPSPTLSTLPRQHHTAQQAVCTLYVVCICKLPHANFLASCAGCNTTFPPTTSPSLCTPSSHTKPLLSRLVTPCLYISLTTADVFLSNLPGFDANRNLMSLECAGRQLMASQVMQTCAFSSWMLHILLCQVHSSLWRVQVKLILAMTAWHSTGVGK